MWNDYFYQLQKKYNMRVSTKLPLVIRLDGKNVTKNKEINFFYDYSGSFSDAFKKCAWYFSNKYHCYAIFGTDEISFIFPNPMLLIEDLDASKVNHSNEIIALFVQYFYSYFNNNYKGENIFFHGKCFSIPEKKVVSYVKYRAKSIQNVLTTYVLKRNNIKSGDMKLQEKIEKCKEIECYEQIENIALGTLYFDGNILDIQEFINDNIVILDNISNNTDDEADASNDIEIDFTDI